MAAGESIDCIVVGYNEPNIGDYERLLRTTYGEESEAYRDLRFSLVNIEGKPMTYVELLNHALRAATVSGESPVPAFQSCDIPNLAAAYLTHHLRRHGFTARYINLFQYEQEEFANLLAKNPLCVAITTTFYLWNLPVQEIVTFV